MGGTIDSNHGLDSVIGVADIGVCAARIRFAGQSGRRLMIGPTRFGDVRFRGRRRQADMTFCGANVCL